MKPFNLTDSKISKISLFRLVFRIGLVRRTRLTSSASKSKSALLVTPIYNYSFCTHTERFQRFQTSPIYQLNLIQLTPIGTWHFGWCSSHRMF